MQQKAPIKLDDRIYILDGFDLGLEERTGTYVIMEEDITLVDTGPSTSIPHVKKGLETLGISLDQIKYIIATHVHLDHSGGAGLLMTECPNAKAVVHPRGARHLADPSRLVAGARAVYGERFDELFDPVVPIPEDRILEMTEGDTLKIGEACTLEFWDTPGHANHHISIYDPVSNGIFIGDTAGIRYEPLIQDGVAFFPPSTSPNQFDPDKMQQAIDRFMAKNPDVIYFGHFGASTSPNETLHQVSEWLGVFMEEAKAAAAKREGHAALTERILTRVRTHLRELGVPDDHRAYKMIELDMDVSAMGIVNYLEKSAKRVEG
ncbi:beta-lactamase [Bacillus sp. OxB-1]|uniref:MBL fold metallo-hydrolase n=1 Tax=Bacillus sp. (strain OxB-1) TaxID=98228 RepID=UPI000581DF39|nr:MBL fold metallo-hydrolase [Bacillus sp. OxB-1]BAQ10205.1 beta-lactamase [Bacillus sp. OxB-1]